MCEAVWGSGQHGWSLPGQECPHPTGSGRLPPVRPVCVHSVESEVWFPVWLQNLVFLDLLYPNVSSPFLSHQTCPCPSGTPHRAGRKRVPGDPSLTEVDAREWEQGALCSRCPVGNGLSPARVQLGNSSLDGGPCPECDVCRLSASCSNSSALAFLPLLTVF